MQKCEECQQNQTELNLFLCAGKMRCVSCFMQQTQGNRLFIDEDRYPRILDSHNKEIPKSQK